MEIKDQMATGDNWKTATKTTSWHQCLYYTSYRKTSKQSTICKKKLGTEKCCRVLGKI